MKQKLKANATGLYEALKIKAAGEQAAGRETLADGEILLSLDDTERVKVLSPGRLVVKRFFHNKLALVGLSILILMFSFAFLGPIFYPYSQTAIFYKFDFLNIDYASAIERTEYVAYSIPGAQALPAAVANRFNSYIIEMKKEDETEMEFIGADDIAYVVSKLGEGIYTLSTKQIDVLGVYYTNAVIAVYETALDAFEWTDISQSTELQSTGLKEASLRAIENEADEFEYKGVGFTISYSRRRSTVSLADPIYAGISPGDGFVQALEAGLLDEEPEIEFGGSVYQINDAGGGGFEITEERELNTAIIGSTFVFNSYEPDVIFSDEFIINALFALYGSGEFTADGAAFSLRESGDTYAFYNSSGQPIGALNTFSIRRYSGQDTLSIEFKEATQAVIEKMRENNTLETVFMFGVHDIDSQGNYVYDDDGAAVFVEKELTISRKNTGEYVLTVDQITYLIDIYAAPSSEHAFGTDGDGMDILARMMYGGRISLMVGFVVVFIEIILGVIMGGLAGFFSGWVDTLIMRIVDVFYCIPTIPILLILGALFDKMKMDPYRRLIWMMATLGILGWASIARLVRGQILSLREQEFMVAQEATGMKARRRIFRHLVPNVMPQLIVAATMNVGSTIIYESTLSFLGMGVKHPMATWGTMINAITSSSENMIRYTYIWIPVGLLICLTVIAFNFVGDGLRDAFDPKMRR